MAEERNCRNLIGHHVRTSYLDTKVVTSPDRDMAMQSQLLRAYLSEVAFSPHYECSPAPRAKTLIGTDSEILPLSAETSYIHDGPRPVVRKALEW